MCNISKRNERMRRIIILSRVRRAESDFSTHASVKGQDGCSVAVIALIDVGSVDRIGVTVDHVPVLVGEELDDDSVVPSAVADVEEITSLSPVHDTFFDLSDDVPEEFH